MTHRRKQWIIYPPGYVPGISSYKCSRSKKKAWRIALEMGQGAEIHERIHEHPAPRKPWCSGYIGRIYFVGGDK